MRRGEKEIRDREILDELLGNAPVCRLGLAPCRNSAGDDRAHAGYPYVVPVHFVHAEGRIYIHSARTGKKISMLGENPRVCVEIDEFLGLKTAARACDFGTRFHSLVAFGTARIVEEAQDKRRALKLLMDKYAGRSFDFLDREIEKVAIVEIQLEAVTGKQG
jgi:nitroimidazol reductase NimA-like FMN-containing flavoprotein (pyridoxamine 5'-phosphate oxidase superfamily)